MKKVRNIIRVAGLFFLLATVTTGCAQKTEGQPASDAPQATPRAISTRQGLDVSSYQGLCDWGAIAQNGAEFSFVRIGYRGYGNGEIVGDEMFEENLAGAHNAGLDCGVYFYSQAVTEEEAREEAAFVVQQLDGRTLEYPVAYDFEIPPQESARTWEIEPEVIAANAATFCEEIRVAGYTPLLYANGMTYYTYLEEPNLDDVMLWYSQYAEEPSVEHYSIWQYTEKGMLGDIGPMDLNLAFVDEDGQLICRSSSVPCS